MITITIGSNVVNINAMAELAQQAIKLTPALKEQIYRQAIIEPKNLKLLLKSPTDVECAAKTFPGHKEDLWLRIVESNLLHGLTNSPLKSLRIVKIFPTHEAELYQKIQHTLVPLVNDMDAFITLRMAFPNHLEQVYQLILTGSENFKKIIKNIKLVAGIVNQYPYKKSLLYQRTIGNENNISTFITNLEDLKTATKTFNEFEEEICDKIFKNPQHCSTLLKKSPKILHETAHCFPTQKNKIVNTALRDPEFLQQCIGVHFNSSKSWFPDYETVFRCCAILDLEIEKANKPNLENIYIVCYTEAINQLKTYINQQIRLKKIARDGLSIVNNYLPYLHKKIANAPPQIQKQINEFEEFI